MTPSERRVPQAGTTLWVVDLFKTLITEARPKPKRAVVSHELSARFGCSGEAAREILYPVIDQATSPVHEVLDVGEWCRRHSLALGQPEDTLRQFLRTSYFPPEQAWNVLPGARETLTALVEGGDEVRLLSNSIMVPDDMVDCLRPTELVPLFSEMHFSSSGEGRKPQVEWFARAFHGDHVRKVMIGDKVDLDLVPARATGAEGRHVSTPSFWEDLREELGQV